MSRTVKLGCKLKTNNAPFDYIEKLAKGKKVLNIGPLGELGGVKYYLPNNKEKWLHYRLSVVAESIKGVDICENGIAYAKNYGYDIIFGNCEEMDLNEKFDLIVMSDVIEHLDSPGNAIKNIKRHLNNGGKLVITTPNLTQYGLILRVLFGFAPNIYDDHVIGYLPEHIQVACERYGLKLKELFLFSHLDKRNYIYKIKSYLNNLLGKFIPRLHGTILAIIET